MSARITLKRIYDEPAARDGCRILVDRIWPRGVSKDKAQVDHWLKELAPSTGLRKWFRHDPEKWHEFQRRYNAELTKNPDPVKQLRAILRAEPTVTFLYAARDEQHNNAVALRNFLQKKHA